MKWLLLCSICVLSACTESETVPLGYSPVLSTVRPYAGDSGVGEAIARPHVIVTNQYELALSVQYDDPNIPAHVETYSGAINWVVDLNEICDSWLTSDHLADLNNDGSVDFIDLAKFNRERE